MSKVDCPNFNNTIERRPEKPRVAYLDKKNYKVFTSLSKDTPNRSKTLWIINSEKS